MICFGPQLRLDIGFIYITPPPGLARLEGLDDRMAGGMKMSGRVLIG
jgi:hypothetical protein